MKIKSFFTLISFFTFLIFISCDDDMNSIGTSLQPPSDTISVMPDTIAIKARTISMLDSVYARTYQGILGKYEDDVFGTIKSDYLCQFYLPDDMKFVDNFEAIDSVKFSIGFSDYKGDSLSPMGLSVYKVTSQLPEYFYTNADPSKYCDMKQTLANEAFTIAGSNSYIKAKLSTDFGYSIYDIWKDIKTNKDKDFSDYFPGVYVTTNFGTGAILNVATTSIDIYYRYTDVKGNHDNTQDTIRSTRFSVYATNEVVQLNHVTNSNPEHLFEEGTGATYMKTPAGVYTEISVPIGEIARNMQARSMTSVNSAQFLIKGYTEKETNPSEYNMLGRPSNLLLIDKDSVNSLFTKRLPPDEKTSFLSSDYNSSFNTYSFGNISALVTEYKDRGVEEAKFLLIPVIPTTITTIINNQQVKQIKDIRNYMTPSASILRSDPKNMKFELVYSKF